MCSTSALPTNQSRPRDFGEQNNNKSDDSLVTSQCPQGDLIDMDLINSEETKLVTSACSPSRSIPYMDETASVRSFGDCKDSAMASATSFDATSPEVTSPETVSSTSLSIKPLNSSCGFSFDDILKANLDYLSSDEELDVDLNQSQRTHSVLTSSSNNSTSNSNTKRDNSVVKSSQITPSSSSSKISVDAEIDVTSSARYWNEKLTKVTRDKVSERGAEIDDVALENIQKTKLKWEEFSLLQNGSGSQSGTHSNDESESDSSPVKLSGSNKLSEHILRRAVMTKTDSAAPALRKISIEGNADHPDIKQAKENWEKILEDNSKTIVNRRNVRLVSKTAEELESDIMSLDVNADSIANVSTTKSKWEHLMRDDDRTKSKSTNKQKRSTLRKATNFGSLRGKFELRKGTTPAQGVTDETSEC